MGNYVGIDLGTTFSAAAYIDGSGRPIIVSNDRGDTITPSAVAKIKGELIVGERARRQWANDPDTAAARFKRDMGTSVVYNIDDDSFTPTELSAAVLKKIATDLEKKVGPIAEAVITIPANFSQEAREATMEAAKMAGLNVKYIINEPTAAALYYVYQSGEDLSGSYVVFDLGGGTFDVSIVQVKGQDVEVIASNGVQKLGGDDFDQKLSEIVSEKYRAECGKELTKDDFPLNDAEEEKKSLSKRKRCTAEIGRDLVDVSRLEFEEAISGLIAQIEMSCEATLDEANLTPQEINAIFLAGGSTRIPIVTETAKKVFGKDPVSTVNVDEVVALGASLYAAYKSDGANLSPIQKKSVSKLNVSEVTNEYFGTEVSVLNPKGEREVQNQVIISKGEKLPCSVTQSFYTVADGQELLNCKITEAKSAETNLDFVKIIASDDLILPPNRPAGREISITYSYDENQMMHATFTDVETGEVTDIKISRAESGNRNSEIEQFLVD